MRVVGPKLRSLVYPHAAMFLIHRETMDPVDPQLESATFNGQPYDDVPRNELHPFMRCVTVGSVKSYHYHLHPMWDAG